MGEVILACEDQRLALTEPLIFFRVVSPVCKTGKPRSTSECG